MNCEAKARHSPRNCKPSTRGVSPSPARDWRGRCKILDASVLEAVGAVNQLSQRYVLLGMQQGVVRFSDLQGALADVDGIFKAENVVAPLWHDLSALSSAIDRSLDDSRIFAAEESLVTLKATAARHVDTIRSADIPAAERDGAIRRINLLLGNTSRAVANAVARWGRSSLVAVYYQQTIERVRPICQDIKSRDRMFYNCQLLRTLLGLRSPSGAWTVKMDDGLLSVLERSLDNVFAGALAGNGGGK